LAKGLALGHQNDRPGGIICSASIPAIAMSAGLIKSGLQIGRDIDIVTKQSTQLMELLRPEIIFIHEDFRVAGRNLARAVMAWIDGADPAGLQSVVGPKQRESILKSL
jgi:LacI family transcriptional regulator